MIDAGNFDRMFHALADPNRRGFIERLARAPASVSDLAASTELQLPAVLKHLQLLEDSGLVQSDKRGRVRTYRMHPDAFRPANSWIEQRQRDMNVSFDRLARLMAEIPEEKDR